VSTLPPKLTAAARAAQQRLTEARLEIEASWPSGSSAG
jgi:hypothetical protein